MATCSPLWTCARCCWASSSYDRTAPPICEAAGAEVESYTAGAHWWRLYIQGNMTHTMMYYSGARERDAETAGGGRGAGTHTCILFHS